MQKSSIKRWYNLPNLVVVFQCKKKDIPHDMPEE